jgi:hypothetical protein
MRIGGNMIHSKVLRSMILASCLVATAALTHGAAIVYTPIELTGGQTVNLRVTFDDAVVPDGIIGTVEILPDATDPDMGDIRAVYFDLVGLPAGLTPGEVAAAIAGPDVTATGTNTQGFEFGGGAAINPLGPYTIGIEIGTEGIGADDILTTSFLIDNLLIDPDLTLANIGAVGVRVQSIGAPGSGRGGSGKFEDGGDGTVIPEPSTYAMLASGLALLACRARFRRS